MYCKSNLEENSVIDVCQSCGYKVWGDMFDAIVKNMEEAREKGDLYQGSVSQPEEEKQPPQQQESEEKDIFPATSFLD
tara:strand:+ start:5975 stop:6208 length:234 start_codon:yes stop_codon:yes gene_type:complete